MLLIWFLCLQFSWADAVPVADPVEQTRKLVLDLFGTRITSDELNLAALQGMLRYIDQRNGLQGSEVMNEQQKDAFLDYQRGIRKGYGMRIRIVNKRGLLIEKVLLSGNAAKAGLQANDLIVSINEHPLTGRTAAQMMTILHQPQTSNVSFDVLRKSRIRRFSVVQGQFQSNNISIGEKSITIHFFGQGTAKKLKRILAKPMSKRLILDLRDNPGGMIEEAVATAGLFLGKGTVVGYRRFADGKEQAMKSSNDKIWQREKVYLLINRGTSAAAELFAAALQSRGVGLIVGEKSAGLGADIRLYPLRKNLFLKLADVELLCSMRRSWNETGVQPDVLVQPTVSFPNSTGQLIDVQLETVLQLGRGKLP